MSRVLKFELFYHKHLVGHVSEVTAEFPSYHCKIDLSANTLEGRNLAAFEKQRKECIAHHKLVMDGDIDAAVQYAKNLSPVTLGKCSWYTKTVDERVDCRIRTPYFGIDDYIRFSPYPGRVEYDLPKLKQYLSKELVVFIGVLKAGIDDLDKQRISDHLECYQGMRLCYDRLKEEDVRTLEVVQEYLRHISLLQSELPAIAPSILRWIELDEHCALGFE